MTVAELIAKLQKLPQDKEIVICDTCLDTWVKASDVDPVFEWDERFVAIIGHEVPGFSDEEEEEEDE